MVVCSATRRDRSARAGMRRHSAGTLNGGGRRRHAGVRRNGSTGDRGLSSYYCDHCGIYWYVVD